MITTFGREVFRSRLPEAYREWADKPMTKKNLEALTTKMAVDDPDAYVGTLQELNRLGEDVVSSYGRDAALSYLGARPGKEIQRLHDQLKALVAKVLDDDSLTEKQKEQKILDIGYKYTAKIQDAVFQDQDSRGTSLASQINSGSRGNKTQLMQLMFGNMMLKDAMNRDIPYLHMSPFLYGTSPMDYWVSASAGRKGMYDVQAATGQAGSLSKQVTSVTHDVVVSEDDCGTDDTGIPFKAADPQNVGRVLLRPFHGHPAGEVVTPEMVAEADDDEEMLLRTPATCKSAHGVCAKCCGLQGDGRFPGKGEYIALNAARSFTEKITQSGISCLHEDTPVRMADNSVKLIRDISVGDMVQGVSVDTLQRTPARVLHVFRNGVRPVYATVLSDGQGHVATLLSTLEHRVLKRLGDRFVEQAVGGRAIGEEWPALFWADSRRLLTVQSMSFLGNVPVLDIEIDHPDHMFMLDNGLVVSNSKHGSGVGGKKVVDPDGEDQPTGFPAIERMFIAQQNFPGGAVLATVDGTVGAIRPAAQGGNYITVGTQTIYAAPERTFVVKPGDKVEAGDALTNGVPNPDEVVRYKGLGEGRRYYLNKLGEVFKKAGFGVHRANLETFSRAALNKVRVTDPDGYRSFLPGDVLDYSEVAASYQPRDNAVTGPASKAIGSYLEKPALYYTIGTRVTPAVARTLDKYGFSEVTTSPDPPPFESEFMRPTEALQNDRHWLPRLTGERLRDSLFSAARKGVTDEYDSPSYVDKIVAAPFK